MTDEQIIESVRRFSTEAHGAQMRKYTPDPYIVHPIRVMELLKEYTNDTAVLCAALLHDVLEDTPVTSAQLLEFLRSVMPVEMAQRCHQMVVDLTDVYIKKDYPSFNRRERKKRENERLAGILPASQTVKYADIIDNCIDITRNDPSFAPVFIRECSRSLDRMKSGDARLYRRAVETLRDAKASKREATSPGK
jgi:guanosine-3',5'-bis(diphosphate) 3'-pyrophosphohydrolase